MSKKESNIPSHIISPFDGDQEDLINAISKKRKLPVRDVRNILAHNVLTSAQIKLITGAARPTISKWYSPYYSSHERKLMPAELTLVYPFQSGSTEGPAFILRDELCEKKLRERNNVS